MSSQTLQQSNLAIRLQDLLLNEKYTDCSFRIDKKIIKCHKLILASASPVFEAMFYGLLAEKNCIEILDINYDVFEIMLKYIYTDNLDDIDDTNDMDNNIHILIELYYCAEKYIIDDLMLKTLNKIHRNLRYTNILKALDFSICMNLKSMTILCSNFLKECCLNTYNFSIIINNNNYHITKDTLNYIIKENFENEKNFNFILLLKKWLNSECEYLNLDFNNKDNIKILMKGVNISDDIIEDLFKLNTLKIQDYSLINNNFSWIACQRTYYKAVKPFIIDPSEMEFNTTISCDRFIILKSISINSKMIPSVPFIPPEKYTENLYIQIISFEDNNTSIIYDQKSIILNVEYNSIINIAFESSIILSPDITYQIKLIWDESAIGSEYPRNIFSNTEKRNCCRLDFDTNLNYLSQDGSILNGIKYAILN